MSYRIVEDVNGEIAAWICRGLNEDMSWLRENLTLGFVYNGELAGGLIFHDYRPHHDVWLTIYTCDKHWCNREILATVFATAFQLLDCRRINILVSAGNTDCLSFVKRLGFKAEGLLRRYRENGEDCFIMGMLREECPWFNNKGDKK